MSVDISLKGLLDINMKLECLTGVRIGAPAEAFEIGGVENIVVKDAITHLPYIPGSSLKGAMRAHYELYSKKPINEAVVVGSPKTPAIKIHMCNDGNCEICRIFGRKPEYIKLDNNGNPDMIYITRLKVDDAHPTEETRKKWETYCPSGVEVKYENVLDRLTSHAMPRPVERVPAGSEFNVKMSYKIFDKQDINNVKVLFQALKLVEDDYLGGYGSRGYGRVKFKNILLILKTRNYYDGCDDKAKIILNSGEFSSLEEVLNKCNDIIEKIKQELGLMEPREKPE